MGSKLGVQRARLHSRDSLELADAGRVSSKRLSRRRRRNESHNSQDLPRCSSDQLTANTQSARSVTHMNSRSTSPQPPPRRDLVRRLSSTSSAQRIPSAASGPATRRSRTSSAVATAPMDSKQRRILEAERILDEIANEYAAKRAAGLVPTMPVPARTLLWEELARNERNGIGKRGQCLFGRDTETMCGCTSYKKKKVPGQSNPGGVCECCNHGGPWHRLHGGGMTTTMTSRSTRSSVRSRSRSSGTARNSTRTASLVRSEGRATSVYSYQSEDYGDDDYEDDSDFDSDEDEDEDDEDIANEVARPYAAVSPRVPPSYLLASPRIPMSPQVPLTPTALRTPTLAERTSLPDRSSIFSTRSSLGLPPRLSNQSNRLEVLLKAIEGYRSMGLSEDEVEERIREDFPPVDRLSVSTSDRSFALGSISALLGADRIFGSSPSLLSMDRSAPLGPTGSPPASCCEHSQIPMVRSCATALVEGVRTVARTTESLYGPSRARKQVTDAFGSSLFTSDAFTVVNSLACEHAALSIMRQALETQMGRYGTGCATMLALWRVLADAILDLQRQGISDETITHALSDMEAASQKICKRMRLPLGDVIDGFSTKSRRCQLQALGRVLQSEQTDNPCELSTAMSLAVEAALLVQPSVFTAEDMRISESVCLQIALGAAASTASSAVFPGLLLRLHSEDYTHVQQSISTVGNDLVISRTVAIEGNMELSHLQSSFPDSSPESDGPTIVFVYGEIDQRIRDVRDRGLVCIPVPTHKEFCRLALLCGAQIVDSWLEVLPSAIGTRPIALRTLAISSANKRLDDEDGKVLNQQRRSLFLLVYGAPSSPTTGANTEHCDLATILVRGATQDLAREQVDNVTRHLRRLQNAMRSGFVLPGNGSLYCAIAAALRENLATQPEAHAAANERLVEAWTALGAMLLQNSGKEPGFLSNCAYVRSVQHRFREGIRDSGLEKFLAMYPIRSQAYALLPMERPRFHVDGYASTRSSIRHCVRALTLVLQLQQYRIPLPSELRSGVTQ